MMLNLPFIQILNNSPSLAVVVSWHRSISSLVMPLQNGIHWVLYYPSTRSTMFLCIKVYKKTPQTATF